MHTMTRTARTVVLVTGLLCLAMGIAGCGGGGDDDGDDPLNTIPPLPPFTLPTIPQLPPSLLGLPTLPELRGALASGADGPAAAARTMTLATLNTVLEVLAEGLQHVPDAEVHWGCPSGGTGVTHGEVTRTGSATAGHFKVEVAVTLDACEGLEGVLILAGQGAFDASTGTEELTIDGTVAQACVLDVQHLILAATVDPRDWCHPRGHGHRCRGRPVSHRDNPLHVAGGGSPGCDGPGSGVSLTRGRLSLA